jgi:hypothetical protein
MPSSSPHPPPSHNPVFLYPLLSEQQKKIWDERDSKITSKKKPKSAVFFFYFLPSPLPSATMDIHKLFISLQNGSIATEYTLLFVFNSQQKKKFGMLEIQK